MTPEERKKWLLSRKLGIGSSDAPVLMLGKHYERTLKSLWEEKCNPEVVEMDDNVYMARGRALEPLARQKFNEQLAALSEVEEELVPRDCVHEYHPFIRASLDCANREGPVRIFAEIKTLWQKDWNAGVVPEKYEWQLQHQFLVTGVRRGYFVGIHHETEDLLILPIQADDEKQRQLLSACVEFWECVKTRTEPTLSAFDYKHITDVKAESMARIYLKYCEEITALERLRDQAKEALLAFCDHPKVQVGGVKIQQITRSGQIPYSSLDEVRALDLERYRKPAITFWKIGE